MWSCAKDATAFNKAPVPSVLATTWRRRQSVSANVKKEIGKLGETFLVLGNLESKSSPIPKLAEEEESEMSGSDVLWALQRASGRKKKKKKNNKKEHGRPEETCVDYTNVRPLRINPNWLAKLDYLDNRLRQLSDTI